MVYYRRRSNWVGWLAFFVIGACVFGGLVLGLMYAQKYEKNRQAQADEAVSKRQEKLMDPLKLIRDKLNEQYKNNGKALEVVERTQPKEVNSAQLKKKVTIIRMRHRPTDGNDEDIKDEVFLVDGTKIFLAKWADWDEMKAKYGLDEEP